MRQHNSKEDRGSGPWAIEGPLSTIVAPFLHYLRSKGYASYTIKRYLASIVHFNTWASSCGIGEMLDSDLIQRFFSHFDSCTCAGLHPRKRRAALAALKHLSLVARQQACDAKEDGLLTPITEELNSFKGYLLNTCGLAATTSADRIKHVRKFLIEMFGESPVDTSRITTNNVHEFVMVLASRWKPVSISKFRDSLRSYFRFRVLQGDSTEHLIAALPVIANWKQTSLPKALSEEQVGAFLCAFDRSTAVGKRDYAIARCLLDLGLRGDEVAHLSLDSFDWRKGIVTIDGGKGRRSQQLPLPWETGHAIADYLRHGRPKSSNRQLFARHQTPLDEPITVQAIRDTVIRAFGRAGLGDQYCGTHVLRHTAAIRLQRAGASLKQIADVLRHRDIQSTSIYAKVDLNALRQIALPWPGRQS